jgi:hypothetical protein
MAIELLQILSVQNTHQSHDIVTLDESWIYLFSEHDLIWTDPGEIVVDREQHTVQSPKFMLMVVWNSIGFHIPCFMFHVLKALPKERKFNTQYYIIIQMISWSQSQIGGGRPGRPGNTAEHGRTRPNKLWMHSENARTHTAKHRETPRNTAKMSRDYISLNQ